MITNALTQLANAAISNINTGILMHSEFHKRTLNVLISITLLIVLANSLLAQEGNEGILASKIRRSGGLVTLNGNMKVGGLYLDLYTDTTIDTIDFSVFSQLRSLYILGSGTVTKQTIDNLRKIPPGVESLTISSATIGDDGLAILLKNKSSLWTLYLTKTGITDRSLPELGKLDSLECLGLGFSNITDKELNHLVKLKKLWSLTLIKTNITDAGLKEIKQMKGLNWLSGNPTRQ
jgi:hypothetical protein